jgi:hypothetical protein
MFIRSGICYERDIVIAPVKPTLPTQSDPILAEIIAQLQQQLDATTQQLDVKNSQLACKDQALALAEMKILPPTLL